MKKTYKNIIIVVSTLLFGFVAFNFQQLFIIPKYRTPIIDNLIDPTTVLFKNERIHDEFLCGEYNSKNTMGAYTGFNRFISNPVKALLADYELKSNANSALLELEFEMAIRKSLEKDKENYDKFYLIENEFLAKQFSNNEEFEKAQSSFKQTKFTILWNSICK